MEEVNEEVILLLKPMCKDKEIKNSLSHLIANVFYENIVVKGIFSKENNNISYFP